MEQGYNMRSSIFSHITLRGLRNAWTFIYLFSFLQALCTILFSVWRAGDPEVPHVNVSVYVHVLYVCWEPDTAIGFWTATGTPNGFQVKHAFLCLYVTVSFCHTESHLTHCLRNRQITALGFITYFCSFLHCYVVLALRQDVHFSLTSVRGIQRAACCFSLNETR